MNRAKPFQTVYVDIYVEGELFQTVPANLFRPELKTEELTGNFGFEIELAANHLNGAKHQVGVCFAESLVQLVGSPLLLGHGYFDAEIALTDDTKLSGWIKERCLHPASATVEITVDGAYVRYPVSSDTIDRLAAHPTLSQIKTLLSSIHPSTSVHPFLEHIGPVIRGLWASRDRPEITPIVQSFGGSPEEPKVSVIVPLYGRYDFLRYQLALFANDPDFRAIDLVYVVDDPRIPRDVLKLAAELHPLFRVPFRVLTTGHNLGYAGANNAGANVALGPYLVLLNSDVMPRSPGWVSRLTDIYQSLSNPGALGVKLLYEDRSIQHAGMTFDKNAELGNLWTNQHPFKGQPDWRDHDDIPRPVHAVTAACMFLSRSSFLELGGLDEAYILRDFEDSDLCLRLLASGRQNYYAPSVELYHLERQSQSLVSTQAWKHNLTLYNCWLHHQRWSSTIEALQAEKFAAATAPTRKPRHTSTVLPIRDKQEKIHQPQAKVGTSATTAAQRKRSHRPTHYA